MKVYIGPYLNSGEDREVKIELQPYDTWSLDYTLAEIILPSLIQLKNTKHGSPMVDDEDTPHLPKQQQTSNESFQIDMFESEEQNDLFWDQYEVRWNWVLDQMIYAFDSLVNKDAPYMRFDNLIEARHENEKIENGFRLFGKYYTGLWD